MGTAHVDGEKIRLRYIDGVPEGAEAMSGEGLHLCRGASRYGPEQARSFMVAEGKACFLGVLETEESAGSFTILEGGKEVLRERMDSPYLLLRLHDRLLLVWFNGDKLEWGIRRVLRDAKGQWNLEPVIQRGGHLWGYAFDSRGRLLLRVWDDFPAWCGSQWRLYRLLEDGRLEVLG